MYIHIQHMVVESYVDMVSPRSLVHCRELHTRRVAHKADLLQHQDTVTHINPSFQVMRRLIEEMRLLDMRVQCQVHILRHQERLRLLRSNFWGRPDSVAGS